MTEPDTPSLQALLTNDGLSNPTGLYRSWREWEAESGAHSTLVLSHAGISEVYSDREMVAARVGKVIASASPASQLELEPVQDLLLSIIAFLDPPDHTRIRSLLARAFTPKVIRHQEEAVSQIVRRLVDELRAAGPGDLVAAVSYPLPSLVIGAMLGIPEPDLDDFGRWALTIVEFIGSPSPTDAEAQALANALGETRKYLSGLADRRRAEPTNDLFSSMLEVSADETERGASDDELFANALFLMTAGHETATNGITNGLLALFEHPDQQRLLEAQPELIDTAVDEMLRFDSPIQISARLCDRDRDIAGRQRRAGDPVVLVLGAGNHDPAVFTDPGTFDITRDEARHLSFGHGRHFCLGASLARSEMRMVIPALFDALPGLHLSSPDTLEWQRTLNFRGVRELPVAW